MTGGLMEAETRYTGVLASLWELTKPEVNFLIVVTAAAGYYLASGQAGFEAWPFFHTLLGTALLGGGTSVLNQVMEREADARMKRTSRRPLPSGRLKVAEATAWGGGLILVGAAELAIFTTWLAAILGCMTAAIYLLVYTPLKVKTPFCTSVGAIPGAMPPLIGWAAARGTLDFHGLLLFAILFAWQFPHFLAIAWIYREDYQRGGFAMLPSVDPDGIRTGRQILSFTIALVILSLIPSASGLAGMFYLVGAVGLGAAFCWFCFGAARTHSTLSARYVLRASVLYLPLLLILMVLDKTS